MSKGLHVSVADWVFEKLEQGKGTRTRSEFVEELLIRGLGVKKEGVDNEGNSADRDF